MNLIFILLSLLAIFLMISFHHLGQRQMVEVLTKVRGIHQFISK